MKKIEIFCFCDYFILNNTLFPKNPRIIIINNGEEERKRVGGGKKNGAWNTILREGMLQTSLSSSFVVGDVVSSDETPQQKKEKNIGVYYMPNM